MNTVLYYDRHTGDAADALELLATSRYGVAPLRMKVGIDVTTEEVEDLLVIDLNRVGLPFVASADFDEVIDLHDTDEEGEAECSFEELSLSDYLRRSA